MIDKNNINVKVTDLIPIKHGLIIEWQGDIGFGQYTVFIDATGHILGESECLDNADDKRFLKSLFASIVEQIQIVE